MFVAGFCVRQSLRIDVDFGRVLEKETGVALDPCLLREHDDE